MASSNRVRHATQQLPKIHPLARFEDRMHQLRARFARRRGLLPTIVPYRGYGTATEIRVLCRVVLAPVLKPGSRRARKFARRFESVRGWRSFVSVPVANAAVTISIDNYTETVTADRGGGVDVHLAFALPQGEHVAHLTVEDSLPVDVPINVASPTATRGIICDVDDTVMVTALPPSTSMAVPRVASIVKPSSVRRLALRMRKMGVSSWERKISALAGSDGGQK
jgi:phosphatidate phosphatase APP1